ncbi:helix-turn-helix domain-containing protein [Asanoa iriomotensis]|uniref:helix-turn-helix domain-containing protein n=1 Tax=Asanoa iriomotensis TaxID=234613 RepID=UPI00337E357B
MTDQPLLREVFGRLLRRVRLRQGRTLAEVAQDARVSAQYLSEVERGRKEPSSEVLAAVCGALGVDLPDLLAAAGRELTPARVAPVLRLADARAAVARPRLPSAGRAGEVHLRIAA